MVRFAAPVISSAAVARASQVNQRARTRLNSELSDVTNTRSGRPVRLPSLYPTISLQSLHSRENGLDSDQSTGAPSLQDNNHEPKQGAKVKSSSLVVGAAGILRTATAFAVDNTTAEATVQQAEEQIEEPKCEVNNFRIWLLYISSSALIVGMPMSVFST